jgi:hypothetical protein
MFDLHKDLNTFYAEHVRLGKKRRDWLAGVRNANLDRLKSGLDALAAKRGVVYPYFKVTRDQGGYAMRTLNQHLENKYDIDVAVIFDAADLPRVPADARERICDAFKEKPGNFSRPPKTRSNAVTVWYADGPHVDFAIYRGWTNTRGETVIEHASGDNWTTRDPDAVTAWFDERVAALSPQAALFALNPVGAEQLRRIVRLLKFFCRSRLDWDLPGGMIVTTLAVEQFRTNATRDDVSLYDTMAALWYRLSGDLVVRNPIDWTQELTAKAEAREQVENLRDKLAWAIGKLGVLQETTCTEAQARNAWRLVFNHDFWNATAPAKSDGLLRSASLASGLAFPNRPTGPVKPAGFA